MRSGSKAAQLASTWVRHELQALRPYHVASAEGMIKLDAMENPYGWPENLTQSWLEALKGVELNRYPDPQAEGVKSRLREVMGIPGGKALLLGNGSDEILQVIAMSLAGEGRTLMSPEPGFVMYPMVAQFVGMNYIGVALDSDFDLDLDAMLAQIKAHQPAVIFLAQPNNPTGNLFSLQKIEAVIQAASGLVVLDEAYTAFTSRDHLHLLDEYANVVVMRTLSKVGLAGLRLGMLVGDPAWLDEFDKVRLPYNVNVLTQASVEFALDHFELFESQTREICEQRAMMAQALQKMPGLTVFDSEANFLLVKTSPGLAQDVFNGLKQRKILVKCLDGSHPMLADCLRLTIGSPDENRQLLAALKEVFQ